MTSTGAKPAEKRAHNQGAAPSYPSGERGAMRARTRSDEELMLAYRNGEAEAFDELFIRFKDRVYSYFARTLPEADGAAELLQQTFLQVHQARARYDASRPFATWLFSIAANLRKDELKRRGRSRDEPGQEEALAARPAPGPGPEALLLAAERVHHVEEALARLPDSQREVIVLHKLEGLSFPEIAAVLGEEVEAVKGRAFRGYRALRRLLDARWSR
jgi:RNA polymerase sigma-70 factor (ECF subfamily)